jgi:hypothetical protein
MNHFRTASAAHKVSVLLLAALASCSDQTSDPARPSDSARSAEAPAPDAAPPHDPHGGSQTTIGPTLPGSPAPYVLTSGSIVVERGQGTLTGSLVTNTPAGTVTFGGLYRIVCFALQSHTPVAEGNLEPRPGDLVIDEGFVSPFCKQFVPLATGSLGGSRVVGAY